MLERSGSLGEHFYVEEGDTGLFVTGSGSTFVEYEQANGDALCIVPDNGAGTVNLPAACPYVAPAEPMFIIEGLPPGTTIELDPILSDFFCDEAVTPCTLPLPPDICEAPGGSLGGHYHCFESTLQLDVVGTGELEGFHRTLSVPVSCEVHTGPRSPGDPVQTFPAEMYRLHGQLFGDPDFCEFIVLAGSDYGLPGPGQTTLTQLPDGDFAVDSFFDITYQIQFEGCPDSQLADYAGTTTATVRWQQGSPPPPPPCPWDCEEEPDGQVGIDDLVAVINHWGPCADPGDCPWDCEEEPDGQVGIDDLVAVINHWGPCP